MKPVAKKAAASSSRKSTDRKAAPTPKKRQHVDVVVSELLENPLPESLEELYRLQGELGDALELGVHALLPDQFEGCNELKARVDKEVRALEGLEKAADIGRVEDTVSPVSVAARSKVKLAR